MNNKIIKNLNGKTDNYILPFFWQHGESEQVLRTYMQAIHNSNIGAVCVESRPHPDFAGDGWWRDMDIILEEARKRKMKVWILDDSHFPTGYCNGALEGESPELLRWFLVCEMIMEVSAGKEVRMEVKLYQKAPSVEPSEIERRKGLTEFPTFEDDQLLGFAAVRKGGTGEKDLIRLPVQGEQICWNVPDGCWRIYTCHLTRNRGPHRYYMNMLDHTSCHKLIEAVYEPHYRHYREDFGNTIAGFFSDEPEIGNGHLYEMGKSLEEVDDLPWSMELEQRLIRTWGEDYIRFLPLLWETCFDPTERAKVKYTYMDLVTRLVEKNFSMQLGEWCREHGVEYIGHLIEDNNQHSRTGNSLGHFFRGLAGQDMAGIDDIGGQVFPQMEDIYIHNPGGTDRDGEFFHYALGKLGASAAAIDPLKKGRAMCEIFGAYGWGEGVRLEKYLADHFMVRGINRFVPHAFSPAPFPDRDCPPHFYAHGNHPQYRHFGCLMSYMNRICELIDGGRHVAPAAILYHGEAEWTGKCMFMQKPAHLLADCQIDYDFIPSDVFEEREKYRTKLGKTLTVGKQEYQVLILAEQEFITAQTAEAIGELLKEDFPVICINNIPKGICNGEQHLLERLAGCSIIPLEQLIPFLDTLKVAEVRLIPPSHRIRYLHYINGASVYYLVNEGDQRYQGEVLLPEAGSVYRYDAWRNRIFWVKSQDCEGGMRVSVTMDPMESVILVLDEAGEEELGTDFDYTDLKKYPIVSWKRGICRALEYPCVQKEKLISLPDHLEEEEPEFSGFVRYMSHISMQEFSERKAIYLEITDAAEGVELFVNGVSAGIQIVPTYRYDITQLLREGENEIIIEVATTLARSVEEHRGKSSRPQIPINTKSGICGEVCLWM